MKTSLVKLTTGLLIICAIGISCKKDDFDPNGPEDKDIKVNDGVFNMKTFIRCFDQLFVADNRWMVDFTHVYDNGKAETSYMNYKLHGIFGEKVFTITHNYNSDGAISSSERNMGNRTLTLKYGYDKEGNIIKLTKLNGVNVLDIVHHEYSSGKLISKTHEPYQLGDSKIVEQFKYNDKGQVSEYFNDPTGANKIKYTYENGNMIRKSYYANNIPQEETIYQYNDEGLLTSESAIGKNTKVTYNYSETFMTTRQFQYDLIANKSVYAPNFILTELWRFYYESAELGYSVQTIIEDGEQVDKFYFGVGESNLSLAGHISVQEIDASNRPTKATIYDNAKSLIYTVTYTYDPADASVRTAAYFDANGNSVSSEDITEIWALILSQ